MIRIVFLIRTLDIGGAERQLVTLVTNLDRHRFDITVLCFYSGGPLEAELRSHGIRVYFLEKRGRWDLIPSLVRCFRFLKPIKPDILHSYLGPPNLLALFLKPWFRSTKVLWGMRASYMDWGQYDMLTGWMFRLECLLARFPDLIIMNSHASHAYHLRHGFPRDRMVVIPNGINTDTFYPDSNKRHKLRKEWGIQSESVVVGLVARLDPMKDHSTFLKAAALFLGSTKRAYFVCVGMGSEAYRKHLHQLAERLGISTKIIWTGLRQDMADVYNACDVVSSSSCGESFPNVLGEAMACGVPCVATDVGDSAWIVGETGIIVPPRDPDALASGWHRLLDKDRARLGKKARERILENFSVHRLATDTAKILEHSVNERMSCK